MQVFDSGAKGPCPVQFLVEPKNLFQSLLASLLHLTCEAGAADEKDLAVNYDQVNA